MHFVLFCCHTNAYVVCEIIIIYLFTYQNHRQTVVVRSMYVMPGTNKIEVSESTDAIRTEHNYRRYFA